MSETPALEPVAWRLVDNPTSPDYVGTREMAERMAERCRSEGFCVTIRPLYDADVPALVEALERTLDELTRFRDDWLLAVTVGSTDPQHIEDPDDREALAALDATCQRARTALQNVRAE